VSYKEDDITGTEKEKAFKEMVSPLNEHRNVHVPQHACTQAEVLRQESKEAKARLCKARENQPKRQRQEADEHQRDAAASGGGAKASTNVPLVPVKQETRVAKQLDTQASAPIDEEMTEAEDKAAGTIADMQAKLDEANQRASRAEQQLKITEEELQTLKGATKVRTPFTQDTGRWTYSVRTNELTSNLQEYLNAGNKLRNILDPKKKPKK